MRKLMISLCALAMIAAVSGCSSKPEGEGKTEGQRTLTVSTWGLSEDVLVEDVYGPFEELCNCKVILETDTTANRYTKLSTNPDSTVDVIELSQAAAANGYVADLFEKIDTTQIPNLDNIIEGAKSTVAQGYGPAYTLNSIGIIYDKEAVGFEITSWADLWKPELAGKLSIPELSTTFGPAMVYLASDYKGVDITTDDGTAAFEALNELKSNIVRTYSKSSDLANMFAAGKSRLRSSATSACRSSRMRLRM
ncbi:MAG: ABC transporter substrate-binding protein [Holdemania filiformis]